MPSIEDYERNPDQVLIDAASDPVFRSQMEPGDIEFIVVDRGDGTLAQVEALSRGSVHRVLERLMQRSKNKGADLKGWVCSKDKFDLCSKLDWPPGKLMRALHAFTSNEWVDTGLVLADIFALAAAPPVGAFFTIFSGLCLVNRRIVVLCGCPPPSK
jgi:hypothetical protein